MKFVYSLVLSYQEFCCGSVVRRWFCPGVLQSAEKSETRAYGIHWKIFRLTNKRCKKYVIIFTVDCF